jgi:hypothetical protein
MIIGHIPRDSGYAQKGIYQSQIKITLGRKGADHEEKRIAGQYRRDDKAGFTENNQKEDYIGQSAELLDNGAEMFIQMQEKIDYRDQQFHSTPS